MTSLAPRRAAPSAAAGPSVIDFCFFFMGLFVGLFGAGASARAPAARLAAPRRGARPPVIVPRRPGAAPVPPSSSRGASSPSTRAPPTPWRVAPACSPPRPRRCHPIGSPKSVPPRPNPTLDRQGLRAPRPQGVPGGARLRTRAEGDQESAARQPSEAEHRVALRMVQITNWITLIRDTVVNRTRASTIIIVMLYLVFQVTSITAGA